MGITFLKVKVINPAKPRKSIEREFLIDSGALYTVMPAEELRDLGVQPTSTEEFILANGETVRYRVGNAHFNLKGKICAAPVVFGAKDVYLLGATTIEALGMVLDPIRRELREMKMFLMSIAPRKESR